MADEIRKQSILGGTENVSRTDLNMTGQTCLAVVLKVHHKRNTADVRLVRSNDVIMSIPQNEGKFSCKIGVSSAHFNKGNKKSSGVIEPIHEGQLVIVGYLDNFKNEPWILGSLHTTMNYKENILPDEYPILYSDSREFNKYLRVFPSQDYFRLDGEGNIEFALHGKTFFKIDDILDDEHKSFDFKDLLEKDKFTNNTRTMEDDYYKTPKEFLFIHRDNWDDELTKWTKIYLNKSGLLRFSRDNNDDKLTFSEFNEDGTIRLKRQQDNNIIDDSEDYTQINLDENGSCLADRKLTETLEDIIINKYASSEITSNAGIILNRNYSKIDMVEDSITTIDLSTKLTEQNNIEISKNYFYRCGETSKSRNTKIMIDSSNNICMSINTEDGNMVDISCNISGDVTIYGKNSVTLATEEKTLKI